MEDEKVLHVQISETFSAHTRFVVADSSTSHWKFRTAQQ